MHIGEINYEILNKHQKIGGGGGSRNTVENLLYKPFLLVAAVIAVGVLVTACPPPDETVDTSKPGPNTNPATQLFKLVVTYSGTTTPENLITFDAERGYYNLDAPTDAAQTSIKVDAEAAEADARIRIWWVNGYEGGGMDEDNGSNKAFVDNIPIPRTQDNVVVYVLVSNPDESTFEYQIEIEPPLADTTLESLVVKLDSTGSNLIKNFNPNVSSYIVFIPNDAGNVGKPVNVTATVATPQEGEEEATVLIEPNPGVVPPMGSDAALIKVTVTKNDVSSVYKISIVPPQNNDIGDARLMALQFDCLTDGSGDPGTPVITGFDSDKTSYSVNVPADAKKIKLSNIQTASSAASNITITYGSNTPYLNSAPSGITFPLDATKEISLPPRPVGGDAAPLTFTIVVKAQNNSTRTYEVSFNNPAHLQVWSGSVEFNGDADGRVFDHVEAVIPGEQNVSSNGMLANGAWSLPIDARLTPSEFLVVMKKPVMSGGGTTYQTYNKSFAATPGKYTGNSFTVIVAETARMIFNADDLAAIGDVANRGENWFLNNDIDLAEYTVGDWVGPSGYYGVFDGNGKTIRNLVLAKTSGSTGLFETLGVKSGTAVGATLKNFTVECSTKNNNMQVTGSQKFSGLVGNIVANNNANPAGTYRISNVTVKGTLTYGQPTGNDFGIHAAGIVGEVNDDSTSGIKIYIDRCETDINFIANFGNKPLSGAGDGYAGILLKASGSSTNSDIKITNCITKGNVDIKFTGSRDGVNSSGIFGYAQGNAKVTVENCYSALSAAINTNQGAVNIGMGGITGTKITTSTVNIKNCVALNPKIVSVNSTNPSASKGRIAAGKDSSTCATIVNCYALNGISFGNGSGNGTNELSGYNANYTLTGALNNKDGLGKSAADMNTESFWTNSAKFDPAIWDFSDLDIAAKKYPLLKK